MFGEINGLPVHVLVVHAVVALIPLAALLTVLSAVWPAARRRLGVVTPLVALLAVGAAFAAKEAGEWLQDRVPSSPLIIAHTDLGATMLWFALGLFVAALLAWGVPTLLARRSGQPPAPWVGVVVAIVAVVLSGAAVFQVYRVGESGSKAVWTGSFCAEPIAADGSCQATG
ncbi:DUF2231 domain-containing protein [Nakamurella sp. GG22]